MKKIEQWDGRVENTILTYDISTDAELASISHARASSLKVIVQEYDKPDKTDYIIAACSGIITGLLDAFWVGEFSLSTAQEWGRSKANSFVVKVAQVKGYNKSDLSGAIRFLEKIAPMASDQLTSTWGGGLQHHFRDFAHHASIVGLVFSIMTQFTGMSYGTNTVGQFEIHDLPKREYIGNTFEEKVFFGVVLWMLHLISDMAGSSGSPGKGTGIPGPLLSLAKELSVLPGIRDTRLRYKDDDVSLSVMLSKIFNGTAFEHTSYTDLTRFDLRTEMGVFAFSAKQACPVIINQCFIRAYYFVRRFILEVNACEIKQLSGIGRLNPKHFLPLNNKCILRMSTIASGVFCVVDVSDATIRGFLSGASKRTLLSKILLRTNFSGIGNFFISVKNEVASYHSAVSTITANVNIPTEESTPLLDNMIIDISVDVDNTGIYEYSFYSMYQNVKKITEDFSVTMAVNRGMEKRILEIEDDETKLLGTIAKFSSHSLIVETEYLLMRLLAFYGVGYVQFDGDERYRYYMPFYRIEGNRKIAYVFAHSITSTVNWKEIKEKYDIDGIRVVALVELGEDSEARDFVVNAEICKTGGFVEYITLKNLFELLPDDEYNVYMTYVEKYLHDIGKLIGYRTIVVPSESSIQELKANLEKEFVNAGFDDLLRKEGLREDQIHRIRHNFYERELYKALYGPMAFAESFISSEWYFNSHTAATALEQTAIITGYLKTVEQLLFTIIHFSIGTGKTIKIKGNGHAEYIEYCESNADLIDLSLGSMIGFVRHYSDLWEVNNYTKKYIANKLSVFRDKYRNDYFHKDNIHSQEEIREIRNYVLLMMYLILGGMKIDESKEEMLGVQHSFCGPYEKRGLEFQNLEEWLDRILGGDVLIPLDTNIYFCIGVWGTEKLRLEFTTVRRFSDQGFPEETEWPYIGDDIKWDRVEEDPQEAERVVTEMLMRYMKEGRYSKNLLVYSSVSVGWLGQHVELHHTAR